MIIGTELTHGYLMHLYAVLAEAGGGVGGGWHNGPMKLSGRETPWSTHYPGITLLKVSTSQVMTHRRRLCTDWLLGVGGTHHRRLPT